MNNWSKKFKAPISLLPQACTGQTHLNMHTSKYIHSHLPLLNQLITYKHFSKTSFVLIKTQFLSSCIINYSQLSSEMWKILCHEMLFGGTEEVKYLCSVDILDPPSIASVCSADILQWHLNITAFLFLLSNPSVDHDWLLTLVLK